jgi:tetratricopeptide (TPR) repeat protein
MVPPDGCQGRSDGLGDIQPNQSLHNQWKLNMLPSTPVRSCLALARRSFPAALLMLTVGICGTILVPAQAQTPPPVARAAPDLVEPILSALAGKRWPEALALIERYANANPDSAQTQAWRGEAWLGAEDYAKATSAWRAATALEPLDASYWHYLCWSQLMDQQPEAARDACQRTVELAPKNWAASLNLGHSWMLAGHLQAARPWYRRAMILITEPDELTEGPLADFDNFIAHGWQVPASKESRDWFVAAWPKVQEALKRKPEPEERTRGAKFT